MRMAAGVLMLVVAVAGGGWAYWSAPRETPDQECMRRGVQSFTLRSTAPRVQARTACDTVNRLAEQGHPRSELMNTYFGRDR